MNLAARLLAASLCAFAAVAANAQPYPNRAIRIIVPFPPGGPVDAFSRIVAEHLGPRFGQQIVVDDRPGANGIIGTALAARAAPDGYTLLMGNIGPIAVNVSLYPHLPYDPIRDFAPIALVAQSPQILVAHPSVPVHTLRQLIALAKAKPGMLIYGSPGKGSGANLSMELLKTEAGINIVHIPYKGAAPALNDLLGGQISLVLSNISPAVPLVKAHRLRGIAVTSRRRSPALPQVPTVMESGLPHFEATGWFGLLAPAGTPPAIVDRLNAEITAVLRTPAVVKQLARLGSAPGGGTPAAFGSFIRSEIVKWGAVVKRAGLRKE